MRFEDNSFQPSKLKTKENKRNNNKKKNLKIKNKNQSMWLILSINKKNTMSMIERMKKFLRE